MAPRGGTLNGADKLFPAVEAAYRRTVDALRAYPAQLYIKALLLYNLSVNADALPPPLVGEALADRKVFANRHTLIANELSLPRAPLVGKTPPAGGGGTQVPKGERLSSECETERLYEEQLHLELTAMRTLFVRVRVSLCFSFSSAGLALSGADAPAVPLFGFAIFPRPGEIFPKGGALGKEGKLFLYPLYSFALAIC